MTGAGKSTLLSLIPRFYDPQRGPNSRGRQGLAGTGPGRLPAADRDCVSGELSVLEHGERRTSPSAIRTPRRSRSSGRRASPPRMNSSRRCRRATRRCWANRAWICRAASGSGWPWRGRLLLQPPILILDDPTASVDAQTENEIVSALREAMAGRTTFVVSSRLSLLRRADLILVLEDGRLDADGHARGTGASARAVSRNGAAANHGPDEGEVQPMGTSSAEHSTSNIEMVDGRE